MIPSSPNRNYSNILPPRRDEQGGLSSLMEMIHSVSEMQARAREAGRAGKMIALVPTMGFLHDGHLSLMREGKKRGDLLVVSIFVNPTQFGVGEDYGEYPRDLEGDKEKCLRAGVDVIFAPSVHEMYSPRFQTFVSVEKVTQNLCGISRPTHFRGVTTVVAKLFNIIQPQVAIFGEKDYQQLITIRQMVKDLNFDVEIIGMPIVREGDGLAMSSRNKYLSPNERREALCLLFSLEKVEAFYRAGETNAQILINAAMQIINAKPSAMIDYIKICHPETLEDVKRIDGNAVIALAVRIGKTRLIDNRLLKRA